MGTHIDVSHCAATPPGLEVIVTTRLVKAEGRRLVFEVEAHDGVEPIGKGTHERHVIDHAKFAEKAARKAASAGGR